MKYNSRNSARLKTNMNIFQIFDEYIFRLPQGTLVLVFLEEDEKLKKNWKIFLFVFHLAEFLLLYFIMIPRLTIYAILLSIVVYIILGNKWQTIHAYFQKVF